jgi:hypothetical protein
MERKFGNRYAAFRFPKLLFFSPVWCYSVTRHTYNFFSNFSLKGLFPNEALRRNDDSNEVTSYVVVYEKIVQGPASALAEFFYRILAKSNSEIPRRHVQVPLIMMATLAVVEALTEFGLNMPIPNKLRSRMPNFHYFMTLDGDDLLQNSNIESNFATYVALLLHLCTAQYRHYAKVQLDDKRKGKKWPKAEREKWSAENWPVRFTQREDIIRATKITGTKKGEPNEPSELVQEKGSRQIDWDGFAPRFDVSKAFWILKAKSPGSQLEVDKFNGDDAYHWKGVSLSDTIAFLVYGWPRKGDQREIVRSKQGGNNAWGAFPLESKMSGVDKRVLGHVESKDLEAVFLTAKTWTHLTEEPVNRKDDADNHEEEDEEEEKETEEEGEHNYPVDWVTELYKAKAKDRAVKLEEEAVKRMTEGAQLMSLVLLLEEGKDTGKSTTDTVRDWISHVQEEEGGGRHLGRGIYHFIQDILESFYLDDYIEEGEEVTGVSGLMMSKLSYLERWVKEISMGFGGVAKLLQSVAAGKRELPPAEDVIGDGTVGEEGASLFSEIVVEGTSPGWQQQGSKKDAQGKEGQFTEPSPLPVLDSKRKASQRYQPSPADKRPRVMREDTEAGVAWEESPGGETARSTSANVGGVGVASVAGTATNKVPVAAVADNIQTTTTSVNPPPAGHLPAVSTTAGLSATSTRTTPTTTTRPPSGKSRGVIQLSELHMAKKVPRHPIAQMAMTAVPRKKLPPPPKESSTRKS